MNAKQKIEEMSNEALLKRKKTTEFAMGVLIGVLTMLLILAISLYGKGNSVGLGLLVTPFALSPIVWMNAVDVKAMKKEIQRRGLVA